MLLLQKLLSHRLQYSSVNKNASKTNPVKINLKNPHKILQKISLDRQN